MNSTSQAVLDQAAVAAGHAEQARCRVQSGPAKRQRVVLFDLLPTVPYYTGHLAAALDKIDNVEVTLASCTYPHDRTFFQRMELNPKPGLVDGAYRISSSGVRRVLKFAEYLANLAALEARFLTRKPDVIHVQFTPLLERKLPFEFWFLRAARKLGIPLVYTVHNILPHEDTEHLRSCYTALYRMIDKFICHDSMAKERLIWEFGIEANRIFVIPHGPLFRGKKGSRERVPALHDLTRNQPIVLWQGIIRPYKGVSFLLKAWKAARDLGLEGVLIIVGTGDQDAIDQIKQEIQSLGIKSSVRLDSRFVPVEELSAYYGAADVVVYPYSRVTTSGALMTGVGYGKAIIASDLPAFHEVLEHDRNALLIAHDDCRGWANALRLLASNKEARSRLALQLARDQAGLPTWEAIANETVRVYASA